MKEEILDSLEEHFYTNVKHYVSDVKAVLRDERYGTAADIIYHSAVTFLNQHLPDLTSITPGLPIKNSLPTSLVLPTPTAAAITAKPSIANPSEISSARPTPTAAAITTKPSIANPSETSSARPNPTAAAITKKLSIVNPLETSSARPTPTAAAITTKPSIANPLETGSARPNPTAAVISRPIKKLQQEITFQIKVTKDLHRPVILDVQLLPGGRLMLLDNENSCIDLFTTQGRHVKELQCRNRPCRLAMLDSSGASKCITVAVTLPGCSAIDILEVAIIDIKIMHDNATSHSANLPQQWLQLYGWEILPHPAHSPDLAPSDFHLFGPLKRHSGGMAFETEDDLISELRNWFDNLDVDFVRVGINSLLSCWQKCIDLHGDYVEK
ncbi:histone-lysine N-methyltransferase SETMAR [Plakobranchus ocellatus]|uniref:Histone-lysine N-methyltransferase SETMAR n=1 Tax=Plakobranchus ocellatus TaxID=259542 RepID=A0AAV4BF88_9GAST|nr:histone-lysine N-methyltransferase SETMAR [Plakobranchus ocellatus]